MPVPKPRIESASSKRRRRTTTKDGHGDPGGWMARDREDAMAVLSSWIDHTKALPREWKEEIESIKSLSLTDLVQNPAMRTRGRYVIHSLRFLSNTFRNLAGAIGEELSGIKVFSKTSGLASLPNEVLALILEFAANDIQEGSSTANWKAAVKLSHVCQHFRSVALACPHLWTDMKESVEMVKACLPRSGNLPLQVNMTFLSNVELMDWCFDPILTTMVPHSKRWQTLNIDFQYNLERDLTSQLRLGYEHSKDQVLRILDAPQLKYLRIEAPDHGDEEDMIFRWDWSQWNTPSLRHLHLDYIFPHSLPHLSNLTSLDITLIINDLQMFDIIRQISRMHQLESLVMYFRNGDGDDDGAVAPPERMEFPSVRQLVIANHLHVPDQYFNPARRRALFSSLFFPGVTDLRIYLHGNCIVEDPEGWERDMRNMYFNEEVTRIFRHKDQYPRVTILDLHIDSPCGDFFDTNDGHSELCIPLNMLPSLEHLMLQSNTRFYVRESRNPDGLLFGNPEEVIPRVVGETLPVLKAVMLDMYDAGAIATWLEDYLKKLKEVDDGDAFCQFILMPDMDDSSSQLIGRKALSWCSAPNSRRQRSKLARKIAAIFDSDDAM